MQLQTENMGCMSSLTSAELPPLCLFNFHMQIRQKNFNCTLDQNHNVNLKTDPLYWNLGETCSITTKIRTIQAKLTNVLYAG
jgi:hypothetical protein